MMKKIKLLLVITIIAAGIISLPSCQSTKTTAAAKMLKFNFEKGKGYDYEMITSMDQEAEGKTVKMDMSAYYSMDVSDDDGNMKTITSTIDRFKMKIDMGGPFNIDIDTEKPLSIPGIDSIEDAKKGLQMVNSIFNAIKGQKFTMKVDAEGKIREVTGFENMAKTIVDSMGLDEDKKEAMIATFNQQMNAKSMTGSLERAWYIFPNKEVKVGDSWEKTNDMGRDGSYHSTYEVTDIEGDMVTLNEKTTINIPGAKVDGAVTGTIIVDSRSGLVVQADQDMKMKVEAGGEKAEIKAITKIKGKAK